MRSTFIKAAAMLVLAATGAAAMAQQPAAGGAPSSGPARWTLVPMLIESKAFEDGGIVPLKYSFYGANTLPDFKVSNLLKLPRRASRSFSSDLDVVAAFNPEDNLHWLAWNIPATALITQIEEGKLPGGVGEWSQRTCLHGYGCAEWAALSPLRIRVLCAQCQARLARDRGPR